MSDPDRRVEIETVVASIRRQASDDDRAPDRLVLTPAHRVSEDPESGRTEAEPLDGDTARATSVPRDRPGGAADGTKMEPFLLTEFHRRDLPVPRGGNAVADQAGKSDDGSGSSDPPKPHGSRQSPASGIGTELAEAKPALPDLDEEMMQRLVSDLVRRELQGELGDRISRTVRKLVRQEIQRALAVRDLD